MPETTGLEFSREFLKVRAKLAIILCTDTREGVREAGFRGLVLKPLTTRAIGVAVRRVLDESTVDSMRMQAAGSDDPTV